MKKSILEVVHDTAKGLHQAKLLSKQTMHEFDVMCLSPVKFLDPTEIKKIRERENVSQPVFAACLNISSSTVKKWETGEKHPQGASLKLLNIIANKGLNAIS